MSRCRHTFCLGNYAIQHFSNTRWITNFLLISDHVFESGHLLNFLKPTLANRLVGSLRCNQQHWCMVPVCCFNTSYEICNARTILANNHRHFASCTCKTVRHVTTVALMGHVPKRDSCLREVVGNRHKR